MASGGKDHRMVFDIRGRRRNVVKVVYAILAVLMGTSLFFVVGPFNIGEVFQGNTSTSEAATRYEEQAGRIERKLQRSPEDPKLLLALARSQVNAGNSLRTPGPNGEQGMTLRSLQVYEEASQSWSEYLKATDEPSVGAAQVMAQTLFSLAEFSRSFPETEANLAAAVRAQEIVAKQRPNLNSLSTLALYTFYTFDYAAAEKAGDEAKKLTNSKIEREELENQIEQVSKQAHRFEERAKEVARTQQAQQAGGGAPNAGSPEAPLNEVLGGGGALTE